MKHKKHELQTEETTANYNLKSEAVEQLVEAMHEEAPEYSKEELERYRTKHRIQIPRWLKILGLKAWFYGMVCFFMFWGLGAYLGALLDMLVIVGIVIGMVTDLLINPILRFMEQYPGQNDRWILFPKKTKLGSFFLNIAYGPVLLYCVYYVYSLANMAAAALSGKEDLVAIGVEPILFGLLCMGFDMLFIGIKRMFLGILQDAKSKVQSESSN